LGPTASLSGKGMKVQGKMTLKTPGSHARP
jgi:hypothetical protein